MADYTITFARSARKELENLPGDIADRILRKIEILAVNPRLPGVIKTPRKQKSLAASRWGLSRGLFDK